MNLRPLVVRLRVEVDATLAQGFSLQQIKSLARGAIFLSCYRGVRVGERCFASFEQLRTELGDYAAQLDQRSEDAGGSSTATGRYLADRATLVRWVIDEVEKRQHRFWAAVE